MSDKIRYVNFRIACGLAIALGAVSPPFPAIAAPDHPSIVFILLDTTRADHLGAWGHRRPTSPVLDRLAARGIRFERHFANSHATRPSMPQLMTGRYYHQNVLAGFQTDAHPREMSFARADPGSRLLPDVLRRAGYEALGVSAHTWVSPESVLGRAFDRFELAPFTPAQAHGDAEPLVDRALALWNDRDRSKPTLLYVHFMDAHIPRRLPEGAPDAPVPEFDWRQRFRPNGEPAFGRRRRAWSRYDARDFTRDDRAHYAAVYDTAIRRADHALGRLLDAIEAGDPGLTHTLVVVTADHGEELGEDGRIEHGPSLADGVQHVPLIVAGAGVAPGTCRGVTEHVDVVPTVLEAAAVGRPAALVLDGVSWIATSKARTPCGGSAAFYAWEDYRGVRRGRHLLVEHPPRTLEGRCAGERVLYRIDGDRRRVVDEPAPARRADRLHDLLEARLGGLERAYRAGRYDVPSAPFLVRAGALDVRPSDVAQCRPVDEDTPHAALVSTPWFWTGRGLACLDPDAPPLTLDITVPPGSYRVEAALNPIERPPWILGRARWRRRSFLSDDPTRFVPLGTADARTGTLTLPLAGATLERSHLLGIRLTPPNAMQPSGDPPAMDPQQRERLRALGYVQ